MATYYIDYDSGSDAANGTTTSTPFKHCPGDPNATGVAALIALVADDVCDFRKGVEYIASYVGILLSWSGTDGHPIVYTSTWGTGDNAILTTDNVASIDIDYTNGSAVLFSDDGDARSYLTFKDLSIQRVGGISLGEQFWNGLEGATLSATTDTVTKVGHGLPEDYYIRLWAGDGGFGELSLDEDYYATNVTTDTFQLRETYSGAVIDFAADGTGGQFIIRYPPGGKGIDLEGGGTNIIVDGCVFDDIGTWQGKAPLGTSKAITGQGVLFSNNQDCLVSNCDFSRMKTGVRLLPGGGETVKGISVTGCTFTKSMNWLIDVSPIGDNAVFEDILVDGCSFFDYAELDSAQWIINGAVGEAPHQDGIFLRTAAKLTTWTNIIVRNCNFWKDDQSTAGGTASIYLSQGASADIYNCVFRADKHGNGHISVGFNKVSGMYQRVRIWNCSGYGAQTLVKCTPDNSNPDHYEVRNCVGANSAVWPIETINPGDTGALVHDYNVFYAADPNKYTAADTDTNYLSFSEWQTYSGGLDANSDFVDPEFASITGDPSTWDLSPASAASPVVGTGDDLSAHFTTDIDGTTRTVPWDIGAYEYGGTAPPTTPPNPPTDLTLTAL